MLTRLKHIKSCKHNNPDGTITTYYYHRKTGKRIEGEIGSPEFLENYTRACKFAHEIDETSVNGLIHTFKNSGLFRSFKDRTQKDYEKHFNIIGQKWGAMKLVVLDDKRIRKDLLEWRDELGLKSPRQADYIFSTFRRLVNYGIDMGMLSHNFLSKPKKLYNYKRRDKIWMPNDVDNILEHADENIRLAIIMALHTGQRKGDLIRLTWSAYDGHFIYVTQSKTDSKVAIPVTSTLKQVLDNLPRTSIHILTNSKGRPWTIEGFDTAWQRTKQKSGIKDLTFHDLKGTAVTVFGEMECTSAQIATITGHSLEYVEQILDTYLSRTKPLALRAINKFENSWINKKVR